MAFIGILLIVLGLAMVVLLGIQGLTIDQTITQLGAIFGIQSGSNRPGGNSGGPH